jgi:hypothetical protein
MELKDAFLSIENHPLSSLKKSFCKVKKSKESFDICLKIIDSIKDMEFNQRQEKINRMFMDQERPKLWTNIIELIQIAHSKKGK